MDEKQTSSEPQSATKQKTVKPRYELGDRVKMKKPHPCGTNEWEIVRTGMDFRLKCLGCGHYVLIPRTKFERAVRGKLEKTED